MQPPCSGSSLSSDGTDSRTGFIGKCTGLRHSLQPKLRQVCAAEYAEYRFLSCGGSSLRTKPAPPAANVPACPPARHLTLPRADTATLTSHFGTLVCGRVITDTRSG